ncbi:hypothetical protein OROHE_021504 [Orobanche hederae]
MGSLIYFFGASTIFHECIHICTLLVVSVGCAFSTINEEPDIAIVSDGKKESSSKTKLSYHVLLGLPSAAAYPASLPFFMLLLEGASEADLNILPKYKFQTSKDEHRVDFAAGVMVRIETSSGYMRSERTLSPEDASTPATVGQLMDFIFAARMAKKYENDACNVFPGDKECEKEDCDGIRGHVFGAFGL